MDRSGDELMGMLSTLMADERFGEVLTAVRESFSPDAENSSANAENNNSGTAPVIEESPAPSVPTGASPDSRQSSPIPPELISKLPEIMGMLSAGGGKGGNSRMADRKRLLQALKPFLSDRRREAVDSIVNIAGIADIFGI